MKLTGVDEGHCLMNRKKQSKIKVNCINVEASYSLLPEKNEIKVSFTDLHHCFSDSVL